MKAFILLLLAAVAAVFILSQVFQNGLLGSFSFSPEEDRKPVPATTSSSIRQANSTVQNPPAAAATSSGSFHGPTGAPYANGPTGDPYVIGPPGPPPSN